MNIRDCPPGEFLITGLIEWGKGSSFIDRAEKGEDNRFFQRREEGKETKKTVPKVKDNITNG